MSATTNIPPYRPKVYTASKIWRAALWNRLARNTYPWGDGLGDWSHVEFTARWPRMAHLEVGSEAKPTHEDFARFWTIDVHDVQRSDFVLLFAHDRTISDSDDSYDLRGGLVECGVGIGAGKRIITIGLSETHSWSYHPLVIRVASLEEARRLLLTYHI